MIVQYEEISRSKKDSNKCNKGDIFNVTKVVETKSIFMRANALKMVSGFHFAAHILDKSV
jgi:hypothetical protein